MSKSEKWQEAKDKRRRNRDIMRMSGALKPKSRNERGMIVDFVDGHEVLRSDTARAQQDAIYKSSQDVESRGAKELEKKKGRQRRESRKKNMVKPGPVITSKSKKERK